MSTIVRARHACRRCRSVAVAIAACVIAIVAHADGTGWFSSAQIAQGRWEYAQKCSVCHGAQLQGTGAPALKGKIFAEQWNGKKLGDIYQYVHKNMPLGARADEKTTAALEKAAEIAIGRASFNADGRNPVVARSYCAAQGAATIRRH